jgi:hypothetical protein
MECAVYSTRRLSAMRLMLSGAEPHGRGGDETITVRDRQTPPSRTGTVFAPAGDIHV